MNLHIHRVSYLDHCTLGVLCTADSIPFALVKEPPAYGMQDNGAFCLYRNIYKFKRIDSPRFGTTFMLEDSFVPWHVLFYKGNIVKDKAEGFIYIGEKFGVLNKQPTVISRGTAFQEFMAKLGDRDTFKLIIK